MFYCADHNLLLLSSKENSFIHINCNTKYYGLYRGGNKRINNLLLKYALPEENSIPLQDKNADELLEIKEVVDYIIEQNK